MPSPSHFFKPAQWRKFNALALGLPLVVCLGLWSLPSHAQLSSPIAGGLPAGSGPGIHSPNSPFAPLSERADILPWSVLTAVKLQSSPKGPRPNYTPDQQALNDKIQRVQGFMMPLEPGQKQMHFLLTSVPLTCSFCTPGGPESMVEVYSQSPVRYTMEPLVVEGKFAVLNDDPYGLYYRIKGAVIVK